MPGGPPCFCIKNAGVHVTRGIPTGITYLFQPTWLFDLFISMWHHLVTVSRRSTNHDMLIIVAVPKIHPHIISRTVSWNEWNKNHCAGLNFAPFLAVFRNKKNIINPTGLAMDINSAGGIDLAILSLS